MARKKVSMVPLVAGILLLVLTVGTGAGRSAVPVYDGDNDNFKLMYHSKQAYAVEGDAFWVRVVAENMESTSGEMYVQCSILNENDHNWLSDVGLQAAVTYGTSTRDNCQADEPFTQTAQVQLDGRERELLRFSMVMPEDSVDEPMYVYCAAFEQCFSPGTDTYESSAFKKPLLVLDDYPDDVTDPEDLVPQGCVRDSDCPGWFLSDVDCYQGQCLDAEDVPGECGNGVCEGSENAVTCPDDCGFTDFRLKEWIGDHKIVVTLTALGLIIIGAFGFAPVKV